MDFNNDVTKSTFQKRTTESSDLFSSIGTIDIAESFNNKTLVD